MALFLSSHTALVTQKSKSPIRLFSLPSSKLSLPSSTARSNPKLTSSFRINSSVSDQESDSDSSSRPIQNIADEWGEKSVPESSYTKLSDADPPKDEDEWGEKGEGVKSVEVKKDSNIPENGSATATAVNDKLAELKTTLLDTFYGTELGFKASAEVRGEVLELVNQLEALNPTPAPTTSPSLNGNWVLLYTAFSELLPLLAAGTTPLLKLEKICQSIDTGSFIIENSTTFSNPFATYSFSASATFEIRSPSRIQVTFKEGTFNPPKITSSLSLPENIDIFGRKLDLSPVQNSLNPLEDIVANISRVISGQPPLKVPIPGERSSSWLITTFLDENLRISRGDGGLFILGKEGSPLLDDTLFGRGL